MKKILAITLAMLCSGLCACGDTAEKAPADTTTVAETTTTTTAAAEETITTTTTELVTTTTVETTTTKATTTTEVTTTEEPKEEYYTVEECLTKIVEEQFGEKVESIGYNSVNDCITILLDKVSLTQNRYDHYDVFSSELVEKYNSDEKVSMNDFKTDYSDYYGGFIEYIPK